MSKFVKGEANQFSRPTDKAVQQFIGGGSSELEIAHKNALRLLQWVGHKSVCRLCGAGVFWVDILPKGKQERKPHIFNFDASSHWENCPEKDKLKK